MNTAADNQPAGATELAEGAVTGEMPHFLAPNPLTIPEELKSIPRWVVWRAERASTDAKPDKIPYRSDLPNSRASSTNPETWGTFEQAVTALEEDGSTFTGIGFVLNGDNISGVDIDHCVDIGTGQVNPIAISLLERIGAAYVELSPSGSGLRAFGYAEPLAKGVRGKLDDLDVEFYSSGRYLTLTGHTLKNGPLRQLDGFHSEASRINSDVSRLLNGEILAASPDERMSELIRRILSGDVFHDSLRDLAASWAATGMAAGAIVNTLKALLHQADVPKDGRWHARLAEIPRLVSSAIDKYGLSIQVHPEQIKLLTTEELIALPPMRWVVRGVLPEIGLASIFGPSTSGKTFLAIDLAAAICDGREWFGHRAYPRAVIYVCLEGEAGMSKRIKAYRMKYGNDAAAGLRFLTTEFNLLKMENVEALAKAIHEANCPGAIVFIDTLNRATPGADENSSQDMGLAIEGAKKLQQMIGGMVVLVHHTGKDVTRGMRGHSSLFAALDLAIEVSRDDDNRSWSIVKSKDGEDGEKVPFQLDIHEVDVEVDGDENIPITSCSVNESGGMIRKKEKLTKTQQQGLSNLIGACIKEGSKDEQGKWGVDVEVWRPFFYSTSTADKQDTKRKSFDRLRHDLVTKGIVSVKDNHYCPVDIGAQVSINLSRTKQDIGTERDNDGTCPDGEANQPDRTGHTTNSVSSVLLGWGDREKSFFLPKHYFLQVPPHHF